jgi:ABC-2 type transport system ATP-binding protein
VTYSIQVGMIKSRSVENTALPVIEVQNLVKTYRGNVRALDGLTFNVERGSIFALLGPNGAGKSTTIRILTTLSQPDSGLARVADLDVVKEAKSVRRIIGCVAQRSGADRNCTGRENLTLQAQLYGMRGSDIQRRVSDLLLQFGLADAANRPTSTYSGGMQRKLDIAIGLIHHPEVLFLDEPTAGLDPQARINLWDEIVRLSRSGLTILLTTHYLEEADSIADRIAIVDRGRIVVEGTAEDLKAELKGDSVQIELMTAVSQAKISYALRQIEDVRETTCCGQYVRALAVRGASAAPVMLLALESEGIRVASIKISRPSLNDVYLRHTGRTIAEAENIQ